MAAIELNSSVVKNSANLKAYYRFESGAETTDSSGNTNTLTAISDPAGVTGVFGQGIDLDGNDAYSITDHATLKPTGAFSIGFWYKGSTGSAYQTFFQSESTNTNRAGVKLYMDNAAAPNAVVRLEVGKNSGTTQNTDFIDLGTTGGINTSTWRHIVLTYDATTYRIYIDSKFNASQAFAAPAYAATNYVRIGCGNNTGSDNAFLTGSLDDVFLINGTALSADQIKELYEGRMIGEGWPEAGLIRAYHFNGNSTDYSGSGVNCTDTTITYSQANGKFGQGAGFNGTSSLMTIPAFSITAPFTVSCWMYQASTKDCMIIGKKPINAQWQIFIESDIIKLRGGNTTNTVSGGTVATGSWHFIAAVFNTTTNASIYVDGGLRSTGTIDTLANGTTATTNDISMGTVDFGYYFKSALDELRIYNVAKDAQWVRKQYAWSLGRYATIL